MSVCHGKHSNTCTCKTSIHVNPQQIEGSENKIDDEATDNDSTDVNIKKQCSSNLWKDRSLTIDGNFSIHNGDIEGHAEPFYAEKIGLKPKSSTLYGETVAREQHTSSAESKTELIQNRQDESTSKLLSILSSKITITDNKTGARPKSNLKDNRRKSKRKCKRPNEQDIIQIHPNDPEEKTKSTPSCLGDKKLVCSPQSESDIQSNLLSTPISRLRCHVNDLEGQEHEIVVFSATSTYAITLSFWIYTNNHIFNKQWKCYSAAKLSSLSMEKETKKMVHKYSSYCPKLFCFHIF